MEGCQSYDPFGGTLNTRCSIIKFDRSSQLATYCLRLRFQRLGVGRGSSDMGATAGILSCIKREGSGCLALVLLLLRSLLL